MFRWANRGVAGNGRVCKVTDADGVISGQVVKYWEDGGQLYCRKVVSGDTDNNDIGLVFIDPTEQSRKTVYNASLTSKEWDQVAVNTYVAVIDGADLFYDTDRLADRNYPFGTALTIDFANAGLKVKGASDTEYGRIEKAGIITSTAGVKSGSVRVKVNV